MEKEMKTLTVMKCIQLWIAFLFIAFGYIGSIFALDTSLLFYLWFLLTAGYVAFVFLRSPVSFLRKNREVVLIMAILLLGIAVNIKYSSIYSIIRWMEVFILMFAAVIYTGRENLKAVRGTQLRIFRSITVLTFAITLGTIILSVFGPYFADHGMTSFFAADTEQIMQWNTDLKQMTMSGLYLNGNQTGLNAYCSAMLSFYLIGRKHNGFRWFDALNIIIQIIAVILSGCRSILVASIATFAIFVLNSGNRKARKLLLVFIFAAVVALVGATMTKMKYYSSPEDGLAMLLDRLSGNRYELWKESMFVFSKNKLFGVGLENLQSAAGTLIEGRSLIVYRDYTNAHNILVNLLAFTGLSGILVYSFFVRDCWHGLKRENKILLSFCVGMVVADCFDIFMIFTDKLPSLLFPMIAGYAMQKNLRGNKPFYFYSNLVEEDVYKELYQKEERPGQQAQKFNRLIAEGFQLNHRKITCCTSVLASEEIVDYRIRNLKNHGMYHYSVSFNLPVIKNLWNMAGAFFYTLYAEYGACVVDVLSIDNAVGALAAAKLRGMPTTGIITDLPEHFSGDETYAKIFYKIVSWCDSYVFLTEYMDEKLNPKHKPWIVMEGLCDATVKPERISEREKSIIFAGEIDEQNGVLTLAEAFNAWGDHGYDLYYYGSGEAMDLLRKTVESNPRVHIMGLVMNRELLKIMEKASLLVNPRPIHQDFVKYSFPSKVMEYMNTGTYHASSELACIPEEYFRYIGSLGDGSSQDILKFLKKFEQMTPEYMEQKASEAQNFVLTYKNNRIQTERIAEMLDSMYE